MGKRTASIAPIEVIIASARYVGNTGQPMFCNVPNCGRDAATMSLCRAHYFHYYKHRKSKASVDYTDVLTQAQQVKGWGLTAKDRHCHIPECLRTDYQARGLCKLHYRRWWEAKKKEKQCQKSL